MPGAMKMDDATFVRKAAAAGEAEVTDGKLALEKAKRADVRRAAEMMVKDHGSANAKLTTLAQKKKLATSPSSPKEAPKALDVPPGGDFDNAYVASQIKAHEEAVALFEAQSEHGKDAELKAFATETLPTLRAHLSMFRNLKPAAKM